MSNVSYRCFQDTESNLRDCLSHITDKFIFLDINEHQARRRLIKLCQDIVAKEKDGQIPTDTY